MSKSKTSQISSVLSKIEYKVNKTLDDDKIHHPISKLKHSFRTVTDICHKEVVDKFVEESNKEECHKILENIFESLFTMVYMMEVSDSEDYSEAEDKERKKDKKEEKESKRKGKEK